MSRPNSAPRKPNRSAAAAGAGAPPLIVAITGASGGPYAVRFVQCAATAGMDISLIITAAGRMVLAEETGLRGTAARPDFGSLWTGDVLKRISYTPAERVSAPPASGSFRARAMVIIPCSMNTLAAVAAGLAGNLVQRAAQVSIKEGRPLVIVPREMPMTRIDMQNMVRASDAGAAVMPACPAFYHRPRTVADMVDFVAAKVLDRLGIPHNLDVRWPGCDSR